MLKSLFVVCGALVLCGLAAPSLASSVDVGPEMTLGDTITQSQLETELATTTNLDYYRHLGLLVFSTPFNTYDGFGDGPWDPNEYPPFAFGHRPTLQNNGLSLRVNGLDAQSCNECHVFVDNTTRPPTLGLAGVGGIVNNAMIMPTLIDVADSYDDRVVYVAGHTPDLPLTADGVADYNGRFANPPFLFGGGGTELLAKEMTANLQALKAQAAAAPAGTTVSLDTHGVNFGYVTSLGGGHVEVHAEGVNEDLVIRPFGRKGENFSMRDFDRGAMQFHFGMQPVEVVGPNHDEDGDGVANEVEIVEMSLLHLFDVTNPRPYQTSMNRNAKAGYQRFQDVGCTYCHKPSVRTYHTAVPLAHPEVPDDPWANVYYQADLVRVGFSLTSDGTGVVVPLFSDLKRHDMGPGLAETFHGAGEIPDSHFITARLWGIADTAPYLHDGRATTIYQAISMHGGEAQGARDAFLALSNTDQSNLLAFLATLKTPENPNAEIVTDPSGGGCGGMHGGHC